MPVTKICIHCNKEVVPTESGFINDYVHKESMRFSCKPGDRNCKTVATVRSEK
jgi:hypothetical protein